MKSFALIILTLIFIRLYFWSFRTKWCRKITFINILSGLTNKTSGSVKVCGIDLDLDPKTVKGNIGVVPQEINIDPFFTPKQIMDIQSGLYGVKKIKEEIVKF